MLGTLSVLVAYCSRLSMIYKTRVFVVILSKSTFQVILSMFYRIDILVFNQLFILRTVSIRFDPLGDSRMSSIKSDILLAWLDTNILIGKICLIFYQGV
jgi:hypothetical protein